MKRIIFFMLIFTCSCKKSEKIDSNELISSNVALYTFGEQNFPVIFYSTLSIPTTKDTVDNSAWLVYMYYQPADRWYAVPGHGFASTTMYKVSYEFKNNKINIYVDKSGPGEKYEKIKVVRIYSRNKPLLGRLKSDEEAVTEMLLKDE